MFDLLCAQSVCYVVGENVDLLYVIYNWYTVTTHQTNDGITMNYDVVINKIIQCLCRNRFFITCQSTCYSTTPVLYVHAKLLLQLDNASDNVSVR